MRRSPNSNSWTTWSKQQITYGNGVLRWSTASQQSAMPRFGELLFTWQSGLLPIQHHSLKGEWNSGSQIRRRVDTDRHYHRRPWTTFQNSIPHFLPSSIRRNSSIAEKNANSIHQQRGNRWIRRLSVNNFPSRSFTPIKRIYYIKLKICLLAWMSVHQCIRKLLKRFTLHFQKLFNMTAGWFKTIFGFWVRTHRQTFIFVFDPNGRIKEKKQPCVK